MERLNLIRKIRRETKLSIASIINYIDKYKKYKNIIKNIKFSSNNSLNKVNDYKYKLLFVKANNDCNYLLISCFFFTSDFYLKNKKVIKYCKKINKLLFNNFYKKKKTTYSNFLNKIKLYTNENILLKLKIIKSNKFYFYYKIHLFSKLCILKINKIISLDHLNKISLNVIFYNINCYKIFKKNNIIDKRYTIRDIPYANTIKKIYILI
ncbi:hypothetical protein [Candidatus Vidania fulgoroideorum]